MCSRLLILLFWCVAPLAFAGQLTLDKAWVFWDQELTPADAARLEAARLETPGMWWQTRPDVLEKKGLGRAAYKFPIGSLEPGLHEIQLDVTMSALEGWLVPIGRPEGAFHLQVGQYAHPGHEEVPFLARRVIPFWVPSSGEQWVLLLNVSNLSRYRGGVWRAPEIARAPLLSDAERRQQLLNFLCTGAMFIMLLYQTMIFLRRKGDLGALSLAAICLSIILRNAGLENFFKEWIDVPANAIPHDLVIKLEYLPIITAPFSCFCFLVTTFRRVRLPGILVQSAVIGAIIGSSLVIMAKPKTLEQILPALQIYCLAVAIACLVFIAKAVRIRERGSAYTLIGMLVPLILGIWEVYLFSINQGFNISTFGGVIFVFMQSQVLAKRFALAFNQAEHLSRDLQKEVDQQTWQIRHIMRHVPQGIGTINRTLHLSPTYSDSMRSYFPRYQLEEERFDAIICHDLQVDENSRTVFPATLETLIGENTLSWNINSHLLIQEARTRDNRDLAFEWNPIIKDGVVDEVLVTVRDVSEVKELRQKNQSLDREYECYVAFTKLDKAHAHQAFQHLARLLEETRQLSRSLLTDETWSRRVLITLHTMKGNARQVGLKSLATALHQEEQRVIEAGVKSLSSKEQLQRLSEAAGRLSEALDAIRLVMDRIFGKMEGPLPEIDVETTLNRQFLALWSHEDRPGQAQPELELSGPLHLLQTPFKEAFLDIWLHLVTNSFDHGLNTKGQLVIAGSQQKPKIRLHAEPRGDKLELIYSDNGRGIHLKSVRDKAIAMELVEAERDLSPLETVSFIFAPGFSTRKDITQSSGRGIGMDAVKTLLEAAGCQLHIELDEAAAEMGYYPFRLIMEGPIGQALSQAQ